MTWTDVGMTTAMVAALALHGFARVRGHIIRVHRCHHCRKCTP